MLCGWKQEGAGDLPQQQGWLQVEDLGVDPLYDAMHVEGMAALAPDNGAIVAGHFAVWAAAIKRQPAQECNAIGNERV
jgi:hypothetical protein